MASDDAEKIKPANISDSYLFTNSSIALNKSIVQDQSLEQDKGSGAQDGKQAYTKSQSPLIGNDRSLENIKDKSLENIDKEDEVVPMSLVRPDERRQ